jgi:hypothetical protein
MTGALAAMASWLLAAVAWAQTSTPDVDVDVNPGGAASGGFPAWALWVGVGVFLLVVIALTTRGRRA